MPRSTGVRLFLAAFLIYNVNLRPFLSGDTMPAALLPFRLAAAGRLDMDPWAAALRARYGVGAYFLHDRQGHSYSLYPVALPVVLAPLYLPLRSAVAWPLEDLILLARLVEKLLASLLAAASAVVLYALLLRITAPRRALLLAAVYAFATSTWATSSQALWQHTGSQLAIALSLYGLVRFLEAPRRAAFAWLAGGGAALSVAMRPTDALFFGLSFLACLAWARRPALLAAYAACGAAVAAVLLTYNQMVFGDFRGGYGSSLDGALAAGLAGVLLSPGRGLFVYTPVALFVPLGLPRWGAHRVLYAIAASFCAAQILVIAKWPMWWGGDCFGPRLLADLLPCLTVLLVPALDALAPRPALRAAFAAAVAVSTCVQAIGIFCYPRGQATEDLWQWSRSPIVTNARAGMVTRPYSVAWGWAVDLAQGRPLDTSILREPMR